MLTHDEAHRWAREHLERIGYLGELTLVMQPQLSTEYEPAWAVRFDSREHLETGDVTKAPFTRVLIVPKDGSEPYFPPTHQPVAEFIEQISNEVPHGRP
ncbi:YrhB domain-containing protein [Streptomyces winkii]|uniref:YrhB domain-containing protein n=1 Tax=Streptomyces winkii TaxID=3051178 RepID=UPI0028D398BC|nr:YrhB domain-containing protein [Streptomyces sp. DSM 40971]